MYCDLYESPHTGSTIINQCPSCGKTLTSKGLCDYQPGDTCYTHYSSVNCTTCGGDGLVDQAINCKHGRSSSHSYCSHDKTSQHD